MFLCDCVKITGRSFGNIYILKSEQSPIFFCSNFTKYLNSAIILCSIQNYVMYNYTIKMKSRRKYEL